MSCEGCKWWESFNWVCCNADSPYVADFVNNGCEYWSEDERERTKGTKESGNE